MGFRCYLNKTSFFFFLNYLWLNQCMPAICFGQTELISKGHPLKAVPVPLPTPREKRSILGTARAMARHVSCSQDFIRKMGLSDLLKGLPVWPQVRSLGTGRNKRAKERQRQDKPCLADTWVFGQTLETGEVLLSLNFSACFLTSHPPHHHLLWTNTSPD